MPPLFLVMIGGAVGAGLRYEVGRLALRWFGPGFPWGTLAVNLLGGLLMGLLMGHLLDQSNDDSLWLLTGVGVLGGFTTFSAFGLDMFAMVGHGQIWTAIGYAAGSVVGALALLALGFFAMRGVA
jgi:CrcB protein